MAKIVRFPGRRAARPPSADFAAFRGMAYDHHRMSRQVEKAQKIEAQFRVGEWLVEPSLNRVARDGVTVQLELKAMDVLLGLAEHSGELVTKHELVDAVWQTEFVSDNTLTRRIAELREAFGDDARHPSYIETIPKRGYRLIAEVVFFDGPSDVLDAGLLESPSDEASPYPGLAPFTEHDAGNFFGREMEITALW
ncbi:MAG: transcriptional regulator, partial [Holophagae bacterium]